MGTEQKAQKKSQQAENYMHERISSLSEVANQRSLSCLSYVDNMSRVGFSIAHHMR